MVVRGEGMEGGCNGGRGSRRGTDFRLQISKAGDVTCKVNTRDSPRSVATCCASCCATCRKVAKGARGSSSSHYGEKVFSFYCICAKSWMLTDPVVVIIPQYT